MTQISFHVRVVCRRVNLTARNGATEETPHSIEVSVPQVPFDNRSEEGESAT